MARVDRRTFLKHGLRAGVVVVAAGGAGFGAYDLLERGPSSPAGAPESLRTDGVGSAVGVDPDDVVFAWEVADPAPSAVQTAYRISVFGPDSKRVWASPTVRSAEQAFVPYAGPALASDTAYTWTVATRDSAGRWSPESEPGAFVTGLRESDWDASWLRPGAVDDGVETYTYLRKEFDVPTGAVAHAVVFCAAAHKYQLWVNGTKADTGPSFCYPDEQYVQATDVTDLLRTGRNAFGFLHHWYGAGKGRPASAPGLLAELSVVFDDGRRQSIGTGSSWRQRDAEWLPAPQRSTDGGDFVEIIDARRSPTGWSEPGYDEAGWIPAKVLGPVGTFPFTALFVQTTRITESRVDPASVRTLADGAVVVDFGKIYAARPVVEFAHGIAGRSVAMHVGYVLDSDGHVSSIHDTQATNLDFTYIQRDGSQRFEPYTFLGFRYLEIDAPGEPIRSDQVSAMARHCTMPEGPQATFTSSDGTLDAVWDMCARSALYTSHEQFVDTPTREKGQFLWDACNESQVVMRVYRDHNLTAQALRDMARSQRRFWPDGRVSDIYPTGYGAQSYVSFTALYPEWVWRYYASTGDVRSVRELYDTLEKVSDYLWRAVSPSTGLVTGLALAPSADDNYGYDFDCVADASVNMLSSNAFRRTALIAATVGDPRTASVHTGRAYALVGAINRFLVRPDGTYVDGLRSDGSRSPHASQLANIQALAYGVAPEPRRSHVGAYVASLGMSVEPDHGMELLRALHAAGLDREMLRTLTDASQPGWARILAHGATFCWEAWQLSDLIGDSMSHGWGSAALVAIQEAILGVTPETPRAAEPRTVLAISPALSVLDRASGDVPTFAGRASVGWSRSGTETSFELTMPPNSLAKLSLEAASPADVTVAGHPGSRPRTPGVAYKGFSGGAVNFDVGAGTYGFEIAIG